MLLWYCHGHYVFCGSYINRAQGTPAGVVNRARGPTLGSWEDLPPTACEVLLGYCPQPYTTSTLSPLSYYSNHY
eukprot:4708029-Pyramimonas_sp.AAC.2